MECFFKVNNEVKRADDGGMEWMMMGPARIGG
jgi:hypothetical protein